MQWRRRYAKASAPQRLARRQDSALDYNKLLQPNSSELSTRVIKIDIMPDNFESIADVGQSLQCFAKSSGLNLTANASQLPLPSAGPVRSLTRVMRPVESGRRAVK